MSIRIYRLLILASIAIAIGGGLIDILSPSALPQVLSYAMDEYSSTLSESYFLYIGIACMALLLIGAISTIGLYFFRPWAPLLAVFTTVIAYPVTVLLGPAVASGWAIAFLDLSSMLWGAVLALTYFSKLNDYFTHANP
jgi:urea transporter